MEPKGNPRSTPHPTSMSAYQPFPRTKHLQAGPKAVVKHQVGPDLSVRLMCPECEPARPEIIEEFGSGDLVCGGCGLVLGDKIVDTRSEWRVSSRSPCSLDGMHGLIRSNADVRER